MHGIEIIRTQLREWIDHNIYGKDYSHEQHTEKVNNLLKDFQTECNCTILNVTTLCNKHNQLITTIYFDVPTD